MIYHLWHERGTTHVNHLLEREHGNVTVCGHRVSVHDNDGGCDTCPVCYWCRYRLRKKAPHARSAEYWGKGGRNRMTLPELRGGSWESAWRGG